MRDVIAWTMDPERPAATAVAVDDGVIVRVGADEDVAGLVGPETVVIDGGGGALLPGFVDAHQHPAEGGVELGQCLLYDEPDAEHVLAKVRACLDADRGSGWLVGAGWQLTAFPGGAPPAGPLDALAPGRPVYLGSADGHSAWVNAVALREARVDADTPDPAGGRLERDDAGRPTGVLRETAVDLVAERLPDPTRRDWEAGLLRARDLALAHGLTTLFEANAWDPAMLRAYRALDRRGELGVEVVVALSAEPGVPIGRLTRWRRRFDGDHVRIRAAKVFVDGVIEARTAALLAPYVDRDDAGEPLWTADALRAEVAALVAAGFDVHFHAIGDRAVRMSLDAVPAGAPVRVGAAHLELVDPADVPRFAALGVVPVFQPLWAWADPYIRDLTWPGLGPERSARLYPIGELAGSGLAFGSDWSVSSLDPLDGVEVAVTRQDPDGDGSDPPLAPAEAVPVEVAVAAYTRGAARAVHRDDAGLLREGFAGDLVLLSADPRGVAPAAIGDIEVRATIVRGRVLFRAP